jgi:hypothetical protein
MFDMLAGRPAMARDLSPIYEETFDIAAGGASLTRATRYGVALANPALLPVSGSFHRWLGSEFSLHINKESVDYAKTLLPGASGGGSDSNSFVDHVFSDPFLAGTQTSFAYLNAWGGLGFFSKFEVDLEAQEYGPTGMPTVILRGKSYSGGTLSAAGKVPFMPLSLGVTGKYLMLAEPTASIDVSDPNAVAQYQDPATLSSLVTPSTGTGFDLGALMFLQGPRVDWRLALKVDDLGGTKFSGGDAVEDFKQVTSAGAAMTLHTGKDALHFSVDKRDLQNAYNTPPFKATRAGVKLTLRGYVGLAAGYYDGYPSAGAELDLILVKLGVATYRREITGAPGVNPRNVYIMNMAAGF